MRNILEIGVQTFKLALISECIAWKPASRDGVPHIVLCENGCLCKTVARDWFEDFLCFHC